MACGWCKLFVLVTAATCALFSYVKLQKAQAEKKDCYFDKECHDKVNWDSVTNLKEGFFARSKVLFARSHQAFAVAGVPEDRIDYILLKWMKSLDPALPKDADKGKVDTKDCYFDEECHGKVDWKQVATVKMGFFGRLKVLLGSMRRALAGAGMPEDRIDFILFKWLRFIGSGEADKKVLTLKKAFGEKKDQQPPIAREPRGKMNSRMIGQVKRGFFMRLKVLKKMGRAQDVKMLMQRVRAMFAKAGMPEDKTDDMLAKWVKSVYPEALETPAETQVDATSAAATVMV